MRTSIILNTDSYKASHFLQYPEGTEFIHSYIESRGGKWNKTLFFGLQAFIKEYLLTPVTIEDVTEAAEFFAAHGEPFNEKGWRRLIEKHNGFLPLKIKAVPEGTKVDTRNVLVSVINTDPEFYWVTSYIETALLRAVWYPTTVATQSYMIKQLIKQYLEDTGDVAGLSFKLHDFGARGVSSLESAGIGGAAHLVNFMGTDNVSGVLFAKRYYNAGMAGYSIPAAEHSTMTIMGREGETAQFKRMLDQFGKPGALLACVADSYNLYDAIKVWGTELKQAVIDSGATVVIRPDSGNPIDVSLKAVIELDRYFGSTVNDKGYRVLNTVRVIYGDGINYESIDWILANLKVNGYSADNIAFGMGGALLQQINRDTQKFAMKASAAMINGKWVDVFKDPITDICKRSKKGVLALYRSKEDGSYLTAREEKTFDSEWESMLKLVYENGKLIEDVSFDEVRKEANK